MTPQELRDTADEARACKKEAIAKFVENTLPQALRHVNNKAEEAARGGSTSVIVYFDQFHSSWYSHNALRLSVARQLRVDGFTVYDPEDYAYLDISWGKQR